MNGCRLHICGSSNKEDCPNAQTTYTCIDTGSEVVIVLDLVMNGCRLHICGSSNGRLPQCPNYVYMHWHQLRCRCARFGHISTKDEMTFTIAVTYQCREWMSIAYLWSFKRSRLPQCLNYIYIHWDWLRSCCCDGFGHISTKDEMTFTLTVTYQCREWMSIAYSWIFKQRRLPQCQNYIYMHWHWLGSCSCARFSHISAKDEMTIT
jgi:hypothetical protein